jgi:protein tyrosine phosphatase
MGRWNLTVKAGTAHMKNKRRKTGKKSEKKKWVGGGEFKCFPYPDDILIYNKHDKMHNRYTDIRPFIVNDVLDKHIASYVPVNLLSDTTELTTWNNILTLPENCGKYDMSNPNRRPYDLRNYTIQDGDFILSEAPLSQKFYDFWDIVITQKIDIIVMLTNLIENDKDKAHKYFPDTSGSSLEFPNAYATIKVIFTQIILNTETFNISRFTITKNNLSHDVIHLWYTAWPDQGVVAPLNFNLLIQTYYTHTNVNDNSKTLVHCSAGVGRTGTFVTALLYCRFQKKLDIDIIILFLRRCRMLQVQTEGQYTLLINNQENLLQRSINAPTTVATAVTSNLEAAVLGPVPAAAVAAPTLADPTLVATPVVASPEPSIAAISYPAIDSTAPINIANPVVASNTDPIGAPVENPNIYPLPKDTAVLYKGKQYSVESSNNNNRIYHLKDSDAKENYPTSAPFNNVTINTSPAIGSIASTITSIASTIASEEDPIPQAIATAAASGVAPIAQNSTAESVPTVDPTVPTAALPAPIVLTEVHTEAPTTTTAAFIASSKNGHPDEIKTDPIVLAQSTIPTVPNAALTVPTAAPTVASTAAPTVASTAAPTSLTADPTVPNAAPTIVSTAAPTIVSTAAPTVPTVAPTSLTADPTVALPAPTDTIVSLHTSISTIHNKTYDPKTKRIIVIFENGVQITADQDEHPQQYRCTFSSQT